MTPFQHESPLRKWGRKTRYRDCLNGGACFRHRRIRLDHLLGSFVPFSYHSTHVGVGLDQCCRLMDSTGESPLRPVPPWIGAARCAQVLALVIRAPRFPHSTFKIPRIPRNPTGKLCLWVGLSHFPRHPGCLPFFQGGGFPCKSATRKSLPIFP